MGNLAQNLFDTAAEHGRRPALRMDDTVLTYDQFCDAAGRVAAGMEARGVMPGDRVGMVLPNVLSFPILVYGALMAGAAVVPMNHRARAASSTEPAPSPDGSDKQILVTGARIPDGVAVDAEAGHVYWTNMGTRRSTTARSNGSTWTDAAG
jgi:acyl-CoA synthetase (AMP-forming)/AMP-acid ligase II